MVHPDIFNNRTAITSYLGTFLCGLVQFGLLYYLPLFYQAAKGYSTLISGVSILPACFGAGVSAIPAGIFVAKTGRYKPITLAGWAIYALGLGLLRILGVNKTVPQWIFINVVSGIGLGIITVTQPVASQAATAPEHIAVAAGLTPFFRALGQAIGVVVGSTITQNVFQSALRNSGLGGQASDLAHDFATLGEILRALPADGPESRVLLDALMQSLHALWWFLFAAAVVGFMVSCAMRELSLDTEPIAGESQEKVVGGGSDETPSADSEHECSSVDDA
ncbi:hypothetical protein LTR53_000894 [Teratosphaeriaceae sp. CCFEE 6253]|nr:hypothetical protein LTR53_000894 [Teratosphaeriaceae sp. CCFEE 6253]